MHSTQRSDALTSFLSYAHTPINNNADDKNGTNPKKIIKNRKKRKETA